MSWIPHAGKCYQDSFMILIEGRHDIDGVECLLVHGHPRLSVECNGFPTGTKFGHAWIERIYADQHGQIDECIDALSGDSIPKVLYYKMGFIKESETVRYTKKEAIKMAIENGTYGDWNEAPEGSVYNEDES